MRLSNALSFKCSGDVVLFYVPSSTTCEMTYTIDERAVIATRLSSLRYALLKVESKQSPYPAEIRAGSRDITENTEDAARNAVRSLTPAPI